MRTEIVTAGTQGVRSYDLDGTLLWEIHGMSGLAIPTPFAKHGLLYLVRDSPQEPVARDDAGHTGDRAGQSDSAHAIDALPHCGGGTAVKSTQMTRSRGVSVVTGLALLAGAGVLAPTAPAQTATLEPVGVISGPAEHVRVQGDYAFVSHHTTFTVWDVSNPMAPRQMGSTELPEEIWGFRVRGDRAYVGANFFGVGILDLSDPAAPTLIGSHKTLGQTKIGAVYENRVVLIDHMEGLVMVDTSVETAPTAAGSFFLDGYARDVVTSGKMAYATDSPTGLYVFDLSVPGPPEPVGILHAPASPRFIEVQREEGEPSGILAGAGAGQLQIYDASNPAMPVKAATFETPGRASRVAMAGSLVFVADGEAGITIVDISTPSAPTAVGRFQTDAPTRDIAATDTHVFVVVGAGERQEGKTEVQILRRVS